jgi:hypothetical protein
VEEIYLAFDARLTASVAWVWHAITRPSLKTLQPRRARVVAVLGARGVHSCGRSSCGGPAEGAVELDARAHQEIVARGVSARVQDAKMAEGLRRPSTGHAAVDIGRAGMDWSLVCVRSVTHVRPSCEPSRRQCQSTLLLFLSLHRQ